MPSLASVPAFIKDAIDHELLRTADKIEYSIEKGEEMTTSYKLGQTDALNWDLTGEDSGVEYSPSSPSLLLHRRGLSSPTSGAYREEKVFSKSSQLPVTLSKHTIEYLDEQNNNNDSCNVKFKSSGADIDRSADWTKWYNSEIKPAMDRNSADSSREWQEWSKREVSTTTPISPFEECTITYQKEEGTSVLNPNAPIGRGPGSQVIKCETFEEETDEKTFTLPPAPPKPQISPPPMRKAVSFSSVAEINTLDQELFPAIPIREVHEAKPLPGDNEIDDEKRIDDPNLMWMKMGPAQYGPPFGSLRRRKAREEEWVGPPCELCHKQIEERRCMLAENMKFHCWHFSCSFCMKTLKVNDFLLAAADQKPYCLNCHKREFPDISLVNLNLDEEEAT